MRKPSDHPCGKLLGTRLEQVRNADGSEGWATVPYTCGRPANAKGPDGVMRCVQHDRMERGLVHGGPKPWPKTATTPEA